MFIYKQVRDKHMKAPHHDSDPFECGQCQLRFKNRIKLAQHGESYHSGPEYKCPFCPKRFAMSKNCTRHWSGDKNGYIACKMRRKKLVHNESN